MPIVLEMFRVDIEVVSVYSERLGALSNTGHKLLHLQKSAAWTVLLKVSHRDVGGSDTVCKQQRRPLRRSII